MPRRAPAVERVIAVLNLLAAHPGQPYTLSDIARDLELNKATLHAILWALTQAGFSPELVSRLASDGDYDLHELMGLVDRGCRPDLAARILAPR